MTEWIELTGQAGHVKWRVKVAHIVFIRRKGLDDSASVVLSSGGTLEPVETYTEVTGMLAGAVQRGRFVAQGDGVVPVIDEQP